MKKVIILLLLLLIPTTSVFAIEKKCQSKPDPSINVCRAAERLYARIKPYFPYKLSKTAIIVSAYIDDNKISLKTELNKNSTEQLEENERHFKTMKTVKIVLSENTQKQTCLKDFAADFIEEGGVFEFRYFFNDQIYLHSVMVKNCD